MIGRGGGAGVGAVLLGHVAEGVIDVVGVQALGVGHVLHPVEGVVVVGGGDTVRRIQHVGEPVQGVEGLVGGWALGVGDLGDVAQAIGDVLGHLPCPAR